MVLGRDILTAVWLNLNYLSTSSKHIVMVDMDTHEFNILNTGKIKPEKLSTNAHVEEIHETEQVHVSAKLLCLF